MTRTLIRSPTTKSSRCAQGTRASLPCPRSRLVLCGDVHGMDIAPVVSSCAEVNGGLVNHKDFYAGEPNARLAALCIIVRAMIHAPETWCRLKSDTRILSLKFSSAHDAQTCQAREERHKR